MRVFAFLVAAAVAALLPDVAFAQEAGGGASWGVGLGSGLAIGLAVLGAGVGQGLAAANAVQGIARNPGAAGVIFTPMILGLALIESIALLAFVVALGIQGRF